MSKRIILGKELTKLRDINPKLMSYNIEMTEVTGGTFWKAYTKAQVEGKEAFPPIKGFHEMAGIMQVYPPIDLSNRKLRELSKAFGPVWVRVSGTWATKTYYDFDGHTKGIMPAGYQNILTKEDWSGLLDFVKATVIVFGNNTYEDGECALACGIKCYLVGDYIINYPKATHVFEHLNMDEVISVIQKHMQ